VLISLTNLDAEEPAEVTLDLRGGSVGEPTARLLTADRLQVHNTPETPEAVAPRPFDALKATGQGLVLTIPPHSFLTVRAPVAHRR
jgi:alpha-L-arabinofuranosidase